MNLAKRKALESTGWRFGDAADFLEMTDDERQMLDARVEAAMVVRKGNELVVPDSIGQDESKESEDRKND
jgi:hypothetical protein